jgi:putative phosphoribosyl transferase
MRYQRFPNRREAGRLLAHALVQYAGKPGVVVLGLPRGGVPVAYEVARELAAPLDVFVVRKLGLPGQRELAIGALAQGGIMVVNEDVIRPLHLPKRLIAAVAARERDELERRQHAYRGHRPALEVRDHTVILVDDGVATGSTLRAALSALRAQRPARLIAAVPVAPLSACEMLRREADEVVCLMTPRFFGSVGEWYSDFSQTSDDEVAYLLAQAQHGPGEPKGTGG